MAIICSHDRIHAAVHLEKPSKKKKVWLMISDPCFFAGKKLIHMSWEGIESIGPSWIIKRNLMVFYWYCEGYLNSSSLRTDKKKSLLSIEKLVIVSQSQNPWNLSQISFDRQALRQSSPMTPSLMSLISLQVYHKGPFLILFYAFFADEAYFICNWLFFSSFEVFLISLKAIRTHL